LHCKFNRANIDYLDASRFRFASFGPGRMGMPRDIDAPVDATTLALV
jgi:hypothetical protein